MGRHGQGALQGVPAPQLARLHRDHTGALSHAGRVERRIAMRARASPGQESGGGCGVVGNERWGKTTREGRERDPDTYGHTGRKRAGSRRRVPVCCELIYLSPKKKKKKKKKKVLLVYTTC